MPKLMKSKKFKMMTLILLVIALLSISIGSVFAESISGNNVIVEQGKTLVKTSFLSGNNIRVDGNINGTTFVAGNKIEVNGTIDGDLFVAAQSITINGTVNGSIFTASNNVTVNGNVKNNIYSAGATLHVNAQTNGTVFLAGDDIYVENETIIERDAFIAGANVYQDGVINGDLTSSSESLAVNGKISGDLNYRSKAKADFSNDSEVVGETTWTKTVPKSVKSIFFVPSWVIVLFSIVASLVVWLIIRLIKPTFWNNLAEEIVAAPLKAFGYGILTLILIPIVAVLLMITVIGIPLSLILIALYIIALYISKIILAVFIALSFENKNNWSNGQTFLMILLGLVILSLIVTLPIIGWIIRLTIITLGLGSIVLSLKNKRIVHNSDL